MKPGKPAKPLVAVRIKDRDAVIEIDLHEDTARALQSALDRALLPSNRSRASNPNDQERRTEQTPGIHGASFNDFL